MRYNKYNHSFIYIVLKNIRKSISKFNKPYQNHDDFTCNHIRLFTLHTTNPIGVSLSIGQGWREKRAYPV